MFLLIDNYDSFTYNLVQAFAQQGRMPLVRRNDDPELPALACSPDLDMVCLSPGPGRPESAGLCAEFLKRLPPSVPVLGVCLGHQILAHVAGARVEGAARIMHGKASDVLHDGTGLFTGLPNPLRAGRYHSLLVGENVPPALRIIARTAEGEVMALRLADRPWAGVQFHPESVLTPDGLRLLANFPAALLPAQETTRPATADADGPAERPARGKAPVRMAEVLERLAEGEDLGREAAAEVFSRLMDGELSPARAGALLLGLRRKGESPLELAEAARAVLCRAVPVPRLQGRYLDIVGTGGDGRFSFNCSTATALSMAGMGFKVLKHGNRSVSSRCGSADVLEGMGLPLETAPEDVPAVLEREGFVFLFAPRYHPSFRHVMPLRRELGIRTLFNMLGPLVNPAMPEEVFLGVSKKAMLPLISGALAHVGRARGVVAHGAGGYDEITAMGPASLVFVEHGARVEAELNPRDYGFAPCAPESLSVGGPEEACAVMRELLRGGGPEAMRDMLALNLGMALYIMESDPGLALAEAKPEKGRARRGAQTAATNAAHKGARKEAAATPAPAEPPAVPPIRPGMYDRARMAGCMSKAREAVAKGAGRRFVHA